MQRSERNLDLTHAANDEEEAQIYGNSSSSSSSSSSPYEATSPSPLPPRVYEEPPQVVIDPVPSQPQASPAKPVVSSLSPQRSLAFASSETSPLASKRVRGRALNINTLAIAKSPETSDQPTTPIRSRKPNVAMQVSSYPLYSGSCCAFLHSYSTDRRE